MRNFQFSIFNFQKGFTVVEILVAILIVIIAVTIVTFSFSKLNSKQALDKSAVLVVSILDEARSLTLSSALDSQYGVHFEESQVVLFKGSVYAPADPANIATALHQLVGLRDINLAGGGTEVVFRRLTGHTVETGSVELFLKASPETARTVTISATGAANADL